MHKILLELLPRSIFRKGDTEWLEILRRSIPWGDETRRRSVALDPPAEKFPFQDSRTETVGDPYHPHTLSFCILEQTTSTKLMKKNSWVYFADLDGLKNDSAPTIKPQNVMTGLKISRKNGSCSSEHVKINRIKLSLWDKRESFQIEIALDLLPTNTLARSFSCDKFYIKKLLDQNWILTFFYNKLVILILWRDYSTSGAQTPSTQITKH